MNHSFDIEHARLYGIEEAILISNFQFWISKNKANGDHFHDGRTWTYNSVAAFTELFPYMSVKKLRSTLDSLIRQGIIIKGMYSESPGDRTLWYAFVDESAFLPELDHLPKRANGLPKRATPFAEKGKCLIKTDINTDAGAAKRASRLSPDWLLPKSYGEWALQKFPHWTAEHVRDTVAVLFKNYWISKSGKDATKLDWLATWQNWCIKEELNKPFKNPNLPAGVVAGQWWKSAPGIDAKGAELGLTIKEGEEWPNWKIRVLVAAGDGPWVDQLPQGIRRADGPQAIGAAIKGNLKAVLAKANADKLAKDDKPKDPEDPETVEAA